MGLLDGGRAVVTGGASGIGRAVARRFAAEGATVAVLDIDGPGAKETAEAVGGVGLAVDVTDAEAMVEAVGEAARQLGGLSLLFNNAGGSTMSSLAGWDPDEWDRIVRLNLHGVFHGMRAAVPHMLASGGGAVVSTASISATRPSAGETPYSAAKAGVMALTASAALEYGPVIRVNAVAPGMIRTKLTAPLLELLPDAEGHYRAMTPADRVGEPEDVADVVVFLCSDLARFVTGQTVVVDGGMTLHGAGVDGLFAHFFRAGDPHHPPHTA
ncbi:MAG TPA: SDR family NAD(P)-dependent oxidoreductase [Acidimicrobiales bacterium]|nr:SDR family NAD(P)-dependent oxidoreductase [Acidimicrobiales bacterium]